MDDDHISISAPVHTDIAGTNSGTALHAALFQIDVGEHS